MRLKESLANTSNASTKDLDVNTPVNEKNGNLSTIPTNKEENRKIKIYNNKLLSVLRLLRN